MKFHVSYVGPNFVLGHPVTQCREGGCGTHNCYPLRIDPATVKVGDKADEKTEPAPEVK